MTTLSDDTISELIYTTHSHPVQPFDGDSLFAMLHNILNHAIPFVDSLVLGTSSSSENLQEKAYNLNFNPPLCTLKQLSNEMACKDPDEDTPHKTTMPILATLSSYSWDVKLLLTLAAFALDYGDFWLLAQLQSSNHIVKATLAVTNCILELERLYSSHMTYDIQELSTAMNRIPAHVYWAIATVVTCSIHMCCLSRRKDPTEADHLSFWSQKINSNLKSLKRQIELSRKQIEKLEAYWKVKKLFVTPIEIMQVFKMLIFGTNDTQNQLFDCQRRDLVKIDVIERKHLLLVFSGLDLSNQDNSILKSVSDEIREYKKEYEIVWIPVPEVEPPFTNETETKFKKLQEKMSWYTLQQLSTVFGIDYIKKEWKFDTNPIVVVINPRGQVEHTNAFNMIKLWGVKAFPFTPTRETVLVSESDLSVTWISLGQELHDWVSLILTNLIACLANDEDITAAKISLNHFPLKEENKGLDGLLWRFWDRIESIVMYKTFKKPKEESLKQVGRLLSYKNESGWALLCKGSELITIGHEKTIRRVMEELERNKNIVIETGFGTWFKEHHEKLISEVNYWPSPCCRIDILRSDGKEPEYMECPYCIQRMEKYFSYKCCHTKFPTIADPASLSPPISPPSNDQAVRNYWHKFDVIIKNIERREARISRKDEIMKAIGQKLDKYKNPWLELKI
ncbi:putative chromatin-remodeling complex ATPase chain [Morella rubra]|uniref:Putative chromatin-remodeling complex ATPase chain n=1 Tax=Morella rubra TaxID=262757 RepID=A0A6A1W1J8_9ROSI|nr:putative chromatin-remodeling complex ATPase chain [Morella rubra]